MPVDLTNEAEIVVICDDNRLTVTSNLADADRVMALLTRALEKVRELGERKCVGQRLC